MGHAGTGSCGKAESHGAAAHSLGQIDMAGDGVRGQAGSGRQPADRQPLLG